MNSVCVALFYYNDIGESFTVLVFPQRRAKEYAPTK